MLQTVAGATQEYGTRCHKTVAHGVPKRAWYTMSQNVAHTVTQCGTHAGTRWHSTVGMSHSAYPLTAPCKRTTEIRQVAHTGAQRTLVLDGGDGTLGAPVDPIERLLHCGQQNWVHRARAIECGKLY